MNTIRTHSTQITPCTLYVPAAANVGGYGMYVRIECGAMEQVALLPTIAQVGIYSRKTKGHPTKLLNY